MNRFEFWSARICSSGKRGVGYACGVETDHEDAHLPLGEQALEHARECEAHPDKLFPVEHPR
jgi:hypothetical protein